jgi:hypothetical protein
MLNYRGTIGILTDGFWLQGARRNISDILKKLELIIQ